MCDRLILAHTLIKSVRRVKRRVGGGAQTDGVVFAGDKRATDPIIFCPICLINRVISPGFIPVSRRDVRDKHNARLLAPRDPVWRAVWINNNIRYYVIHSYKYIIIYKPVVCPLRCMYLSGRVVTIYLQMKRAAVMTSAARSFERNT